MLIKNTSTRFGSISVFLHWFMAIVMIGLLIEGLYMVQLSVSIQKLKHFAWHKEYGIVILILVLLRLTWRLTNVTPSLSILSPWEVLAARSMHWAFYIFMFILPITGWMLSSASGIPVSFFGLFLLPDLVAPDENLRLFLTEVHKWLAYCLIAAICLHVAAALKHHFINKDDILTRML